ncbi:MAG: carboxypeptidase M32 [Phycisphaerales bacterium]|nr:carboxypeptidase M32 [Phycisphaerales bacterium]
MTTATTAVGALSALDKSKPYAELCALLRDAAVWKSVNATLSWDQETLMPPRAAPLRADQLQSLSGLVHEKFTNPRILELVNKAEADTALADDDTAKANLREIRRDYEKHVKLPKSLVEELARCASLGMHAWKEAREKSDFSIFRPWLEKTIELSRKKAECFGIPAGGELYDALFDEYEPKMTAARTAEIFKPLREFTVNLIDRVRGATDNFTKAPDTGNAHRDTPIDQQKLFSKRILEQMGFDFMAGRLDVSTHPFCESPGPGDTRLTNRYRPDGWLDSVSSAMHEGGHGLYEQGLPPEWFGTPLGDAISLGIHESQSRMWENFVGRSRPFWGWAFGLAKDVFGENVMHALDADKAYKAANLVAPSFIRVEADEVTYNLHIMLRFDLERAMVAGDLAPKDLPGVWNKRMKSDFGLDVPNDAKGCLQDIHWSMGAVGYFSTYTLGNLYAAQFWEAMAKDIPNRGGMMGKGEFMPILDWLREKIHRHGRHFSAEDLCKRITGAPLQSDALMRHLDAKVKAVYNV